MTRKIFLNISANSGKVTLAETHDHLSLEKPSNAAMGWDGRCEGKFVIPNVINLFKRHLSKDEISLLSKGLKFIPTPKHINPIVSNPPFLYPLKILESRQVFWCFQGVGKECIGNEWINKALIKEERESYGRKLRLIYYYRNEKR